MPFSISGGNTKYLSSTVDKFVPQFVPVFAFTPYAYLITQRNQLGRKSDEYVASVGRILYVTKMSFKLRKWLIDFNLSPYSGQLRSRIREIMFIFSLLFRSRSSCQIRSAAKASCVRRI